jgi:hypothetical protein
MLQYYLATKHTETRLTSNLTFVVTGEGVTYLSCGISCVGPGESEMKKRYALPLTQKLGMLK